MSDVAAPESTELAIAGMTCASCVARVRKSLERVPGVASARVNLASERAVVEHGAGVSPPALVSAVEAAGYRAKPLGSHHHLGADEDAQERERSVARKRALLILGVVLLVPALGLGMGPFMFPSKDWIMLGLALLAWGVVGFDFHRGALNELRHGGPGMDSLVSLGSTAALGYSLYASAVGRPTYYETAVAIVVLITIGKYLETAARARTNVAIRRLLELRPTTAVLVRADGTQAVVPVDSLEVGDVVLVAPGERIPVDGDVIEGESAVDASMVTGESVPRDVSAGARVIGGTVNGDGLLRVRTGAVGAGTMLARIVKAVRDAQGSQAPVQDLADRVAAIFVPAILVVALLTLVGWMLAGRGWEEGLVAAVAVVVVACPCAMGLATPTAVMVGVGIAARRGILFKDAQAMERAGTTTTVVFDKTGTVTRGVPALVGVHPASGTTPDRLLAVAAAAESASTHPFARAIVAAAELRGLDLPPTAQTRAVRGRGVRARVDGADVLVGTGALLREDALDVPRDTDGAPDGVTRIHVAQGSALLGTLDLLDELRPGAPEAVQALRQIGIGVALISGDGAGPVARVAGALGIERWRAEALPEEKAAYIRDLQRAGERVAFVGDGINDAPALAAADTGMAMGGGAEIALEAAHAAIVSNDPRAVATAVVLSRATMRTIRQNLFWAFAYNVVLVPLAVAGVVQPAFAAGAMGLSSVFVIGNSLLLNRRA